MRGDRVGTRGLMPLALWDPRVFWGKNSATGRLEVLAMKRYMDPPPPRAWCDRFLWWPTLATDTYAKRRCWAWLEFARVWEDGRVELHSLWI